MKTKELTAKRLARSIVTAVILALCLCGTTLALVRETVAVENNTFETGIVSINLNDGRPVIQKHEYIFEPGMTVVKDFFIENNSTWSVYYKLYFDKIEGDLADVLEITIAEKDTGTVLCEGTALELTRDLVGPAVNELAVNERRELTITFHYPEGAGNDTQDGKLRFNLCADAVQTKNNPDMQFDNVVSEEQP